MSNYDERKNLGESIEPEIFGRSKTRDEIKAEAKAEKASRRAAAKEARLALKAEKKSQPKEKHPEMIVMLVALGVIVVGCIVALALQFVEAAEEEGYARNESFSTYFVDEEAAPELADDGITAAVNQVYYTNKGYLCVSMTLGNGMETEQVMDSIQVKILNEEDELVASGYTDKVNQKFSIPAGGTTAYTFYISPEHVSITDDPLTTISYDIEIHSSEKE